MREFRDQSAFSVRCEWGPLGLAALAPSAQLVIIVDVLSFSTAVDVAVARGAEIYPHPSKGMSAAARARDLNATLAIGRAQGDFSLSPASMLSARPGQKIVLPSPNGSALSLDAGAVAPNTICASFRNVSAVARYASRLAPIAIIPAGERWPDASLRPAVEDIACAGALVEQLPGSRSTESLAALGVWERFRGNLLGCLLACSSGLELVETGYHGDVEMAADLDVSRIVPILRDGRYIAGEA